MLEQFKISKFRVTFKFLSNVILPAVKGSTIRGAFGYTFKKLVCCNKYGECKNCILVEKCAYSYIFETVPPYNTEIMQKYNSAPHPFVFEYNDFEKENYKKGDKFKFNFILIGRAIEYLPYFVYSIIQMGKEGIGRKKAGKFVVDKIEAVNNSSRTIYDGDNNKFVNRPIILGYQDIVNKILLGKNEIILEVVSPLRIKYRRKYVSDLDFHVLFRNLLRRISLVSYFHLNEKIEIDFKKFIESSKNVKTVNSDLKWYDWKRYSNKQDNFMKLGGLIGTVKYSGDFSEYYPWLCIGEHIHVGKGISFGNGKYIIKT